MCLGPHGWEGGAAQGGRLGDAARAVKRKNSRNRVAMTLFSMM